MTLDNFGTWTWSIMEHCDTEVFADEYFAQVSFLCWRGQSLKSRRRVVSSHCDHHWSQNKSHRMSKEYLETKFHHVSSLCIFFHHMSTLFDNLFPPCLFNVSPFWSILHQFLTIFPRISPFLIMFPWFFLGFCFGFVPLCQHFSHVERECWGSATGLGNPGDGDSVQRSHAGVLQDIFFLSMKVSYWGNMGKSFI